MLAARSRQRQVAQIAPEFDLLGRLDHGDAPVRLLLEDRAVERMAAAVADDAGVEDQARVGLPEVARDDLGEHRAEYQVGAEFGDRRAHGVRLGGGGHADEVPAGGELDVGVLGEAVVGAGQQQNAHHGSFGRPAAISRGTG